MEIKTESIGELNEVVKIQLKPEDYKGRVDATIKKTRKNVQMPGFRPGHVPEGMVRKMYGKSILLDELNKIVSESLDKFISENKIDILGHPIPYKQNFDNVNLDNPADFEFAFELGLAPKFNLSLPPAHTFPYYEVIIDDEKVETYVEDIRRRHGKYSTPDFADENSILYAVFTEVDNDNNPVENGISTSTTLAIDLIKDQEIKEKLIGIKKDDVIVIDLVKAMDNVPELSHMLNISKEKVLEIKNNFEVKVISVNRIEKADLNQELFDKAYGEGAVKTEEEFREKVRDEISAMFAIESDRKLHHDIQDELLHEKISLPDEFLKRWLLNTNDKPVSADQVENEYSNYAVLMKWKLIENRIISANDIKISKEEINNFARQMILNQFSQYGNTSFLTDEMMAGMIKNYVSKEENVRKISESVLERKVFNYLASVVIKDIHKVTYDEFKKILSDHQHHH
jgi:trigger factor